MAVALSAIVAGSKQNKQNYHEIFFIHYLYIFNTVLPFTAHS
jgi:hypothetical protein